MISRTSSLPAMLATGAVALLTSGGSAVAQQVGDAAAGRKLAVEWCSACHVVESTGRQRGTDSAPPFAALAADPRTTEFRLRAFLMTPHQNMPDFRLSRTETDDLVAYILSLRVR